MTDIIKGFSGQYSFLSNFAYRDVEYDGVVYPTNEHAFQAAKFDDIEYREIIRLADSPQQAKTFGRTRAVPIRENWDDGVAVQVMSFIVAQKFETNPFRDKLLSTKDAVLIETNSWGDDIWGDSTKTSTRGRNQLGIILMSVRSCLQVARM
jgi:ribA/ribD-fused uncharacterized protein